ncbi:hypothetical protein [Actinomadura sp. 9N407]|uniref:hypothetical protein n=1 Tax=Actinomadura sp. 9N407 TaxID=3375154 RepID=UPI0037B45BF3
MEIWPGWLGLRLPWYLGREIWWVPIGEVHVVDMSSWRTIIKSSDVFEDPVTIAKFITTHDFAPSTLLLLFTTPQPMPPLDMKPLLVNFSGYLASEQVVAANGVDGVLLRARRPADATRRLAAAGVPQVHEPREWQRRYRPLVTDPIERATVRARRSQRSVVAFVGLTLALSIPLTAELGLRVDFPRWLWGVIALGYGAFFVLMLLHRFIDRSITRRR